MQFNQHSQSIRKQINRPEKGDSLSREGKKEGVWGRNFCLPALLSFGLAHTSHTRRPRGGGRRGRELPGKLFHSRVIVFKISPNFFIEGQPTRILRFCGRNFPRFFQAASHFLPPELKVPNFRKESDNFSVRSTVCPKAITTNCL